ncbi:hypothetical protein B0H66DRAFT_195294 [Apodospora peruviana]|uniref:Uncharacterized protein n=1 Tax=Apodospora peruviana TaxID=516989 RepID=A0AAE0IC57_9PEZI|nr:hypothetical protein B0H66DRAFT_195294 [Apodospora peruviana]
MKKIVLEDERFKVPRPSGQGEEKPPTSSSQQPAVEGQQQEDVHSGPARLLPPELMGIIVPSLQMGAAGGALGLFVGATAGIVRTSTPVLFSLVTGGQWFALSSSYYAARQVSLQALRGNQEHQPADKVKASTIAGGFAGMVGGLIRGPRNVLPGTVLFALFGAGGQKMANAYYARKSSAPEEQQPGGFLERVLSSKWSPVTPLSDQQYAEMLEEKLLRVEAELSIVDDYIKEIRAEATNKPDKDSSEASKPTS